MTFESEWARCAPWLQAALDRSPDGYSLQEVLTEIYAHRSTFWPARHAAMVTEVWAGEQGREANVWLAGGDLRELLAMAPLVEGRLKQDGFTAVTIMGRPGWARALKNSGYIRHDSELRKVL